MYELGLDAETFRPMASFKNETGKIAVGMKPMVVFSGAILESETGVYAGLRSYFLDFFRGPVVEKVDVSGLQYIISIAAAEPKGEEDLPKIHFRVFKILTKRSGHKLPRIELEEMGPRMDFDVRRTQLPDDGVMKEALKTPRALVVCLIAQIPLNQANISSGKVKEEHRDRHHWRQDWPYPSRQARDRKDADTQDEGSQAEKRRRGRYGARCACCVGRVDDAKEEEEKGGGRVKIMSFRSGVGFASRITLVIDLLHVQSNLNIYSWLNEERRLDADEMYGEGLHGYTLNLTSTITQRLVTRKDISSAFAPSQTCCHNSAKRFRKHFGKDIPQLPP